jgi:hypothetical protein
MFQPFLCGIQVLGRACQGLIDARRRYPKGTHEVNLYHYIEPDVTPQNAVLVASTIFYTTR